MKILKVDNDFAKKEFLEMATSLYVNYPKWIRPLDKDLNDVFDKEVNKFFRHGELERWILVENNKTIGRIAAFINKKTCKTSEYVTGGVGFFECINNQQAANLLFDTCMEWLKSKEMEAMEGPINFGERLNWWGLLVDGFEHEPNYVMGYHLPYYKSLFENYGFKAYYEQFTFHRPVQGELPPVYADKANRIARDSRYTFETIKKKHLEKYAEDFRTVYNKAWVKHKGVGELSKAVAMSMMKQLKDVLDEDLVWFAYHDKVPVGFFIMIPELNQIFKHFNGNFNKKNPLHLARFLYYKLTGKCKKMFGVVFGITPEFQGRGLEGAIVMAAAKRIQPSARYTDFEMNWIGSFNPKMIHICESVGSKAIKTHVTFKKIFDDTKPFFRMKDIE